jgi:predicted naringenin-chalcone synthase
MKNAISLFSFETHQPLFHLKQKEILDWIKRAHRKSNDVQSITFPDIPLERFIERYAVKDNLIEQRYFESDDVFTNDWMKNEIYQITQSTPMGKTIDERHKFYGSRANQIFEKLYPLNSIEPDHLIHVTCTGYLAPSPAQILVSKRNWIHTEVTHAYHMGCYASMPSIRLAQSLHSFSKKTIDVVHTEMCSLHMNPSVHDPEQIVVQTLFADGHIKYKVGITDNSTRSLSLIKIKEKIVSDSIEGMTWNPAPWGMQMTLSKDVPSKLKDIISEFCNELIEDAGLNSIELIKNSLFAIHPGGPKIIDSIQNELKLSEEQLFASRKILRERGNMSSATLPHIWDYILKSHYLPNQYVISFAFGPGLTIFGAILKVN